MADYDVFISFRNSDENGNPTRDAVMAESLYYALLKKGYNPFFSKYSIDNGGRSDYMTAINEALESAKVLVAVGTSRKNLTSRWVKREINMFSALMMREEEGALTLLSYRSPDFPPEDLPANLADLQSYEDEKAVVRLIDTCLQDASGFRNDGDCTQLLYDYETTELSANLPPVNPSKGLQIGSVLDGRYEILHMVGQGGMSCVYLAMDNWKKRQCAVKEIRRDGIRDFSSVLHGLFIEADLMRGLNHPAFPKIFDTIDTPDAFIIVMEYVEGQSLSRVLSQYGRQDEAHVLDFARQLGQALDYLHNQPQPIIYRDMKPANIMLKPDGKIMMLDFGTARRYKETAMGDTTCLGTVGYAAPEQFGGMGQTDVRTDIYCLGATLYHLVTGCNPAAPPYEIVPVRQWCPELSRGLEIIIQKCTQKNPDQRYQSAKEFLDALDNIQKLGKPSFLESFLKDRASPINWQEIKDRKIVPPFQVPKGAGPVAASGIQPTGTLEKTSENRKWVPPIPKPAIPQRPVPQAPAVKPSVPVPPPPIPKQPIPQRPVPQAPVVKPSVPVPPPPIPKQPIPQRPVPQAPAVKPSVPVPPPPIPQRPVSQPAVPQKPVPRRPSLAEIKRAVREQEEKFYSAPTAPLEPPKPPIPAAPPMAPRPAAPTDVSSQIVSVPAAAPVVSEPAVKEPMVAAENRKPKARKVTVKSVASSNANQEMDAVIAKLMTLDPKSQQIVCDLIERLSQ